jgi:hypothetical protein
MEHLGILVKEDEHFLIFNYSIGCDFSNPIVQEARGIILDKTTYDVVCYPFRKFGNSHESYADKIEWSTARVLEKMDGSIIKLWFNPYTNSWQFSTNGMIDAKNAIHNSGKSFYSLVESCDNYNNIPFDILNKDYTYIFELTSPLNQVVVQYSESLLYHIGTRNNKTGYELEANIGIIKPKEYALHSLTDCITAVQKLNFSDSTEHEGFVVVDASYNRIKIKSPEYIFCHHLINNNCLDYKEIALMLRVDDISIETIKKQYPHYISMINEVEERYSTIKREITDAVAYVSTLEGDRKTIALAIKNNPYKHFQFGTLDGRTVDEMLAKMTDAAFVRLIVGDLIEI